MEAAPSQGPPREEAGTLLAPHAAHKRNQQCPLQPSPQQLPGSLWNTHPPPPLTKLAGHGARRASSGSSRSLVGLCLPPSWSCPWGRGLGRSAGQAGGRAHGTAAPGGPESPARRSAALACRPRATPKPATHLREVTTAAWPIWQKSPHTAACPTEDHLRLGARNQGLLLPRGPQSRSV